LKKRQLGSLVLQSFSLLFQLEMLFRWVYSVET
jgi:hypothetical protein